MQRFTLPSPAPSRWAQNNRIPFWYLPPPRRAIPAPGVILAHGYGMSKDVSLIVGRMLARYGYATVVPDLPFHGERAVGPLRPVRAPGEAAGVRLFPFGGDLGAYVAAAEQAMADLAACREWLARRPEVDAQRIALAGYSLGGILACLVCGAVPGFCSGLAIAGGGDFAHIIFTSRVTAPIRADLLAAGWTPAEVRSAFAPVDPVTHAHKLRNFLMVHGLRDDVLPPEAARAVIQRFDPDANNRVVWGTWGHLPPLLPTRRAVLDHLRATLEGPAAVPEAAR